MSSYAIHDPLVHGQDLWSQEAVPAAAPHRITFVQLLVLGAFVAVLGATYIYIGPLIAGVMYVVGYVALTWVRPDLALVVMFAATAFPFDVGGGPVKMAVGEISLVLATPVLLIRSVTRREPLAPNPIKWPVLAYFGVCLISSSLNGFTKETLSSMGQMFIYVVLAVFVFSSCLNEDYLFRAAFLGLLISATAVAVMLTITRNQYVFNVNKNGNGATLSFAMIICGEQWFAAQDPRRKRRVGLLSLVIFTGLFFSLSRGAWVGASAGLGLIAALRRRFKLLLRGVIVASLVIAIAWQFLPSAEKDYVADLHSDSHNVKTRLVSVDYAMHYFETSPLWGVGVGLRKQYDATNLVMSTLAETGVMGLITLASVFVVLAAQVLRIHLRIDRMSSVFSLLGIGAGLTLCAVLHGMVDHYWGRGLLVPWCGVGMVFYAAKASSLGAVSAGQDGANRACPVQNVGDL